ncbi:phage tail protein X [Pseudomonas baetica]|uniref:Phage tail protein X n=1 Tax=Pseudomonas baetica TaxID=674054 RepID=A0ABX4Q6I6_9PSED|nr:phage tail protein X [Pseudomonas baetica]
MAVSIRAQQNDTVDALCWRHYGRTAGVSEAVLEANPGLADHGPILPQGLLVRMPETANGESMELNRRASEPNHSDHGWKYVLPPRHLGLAPRLARTELARYLLRSSSPGHRESSRDLWRRHSAPHDD